jgi:hypothetical protein
LQPRRKPPGLREAGEEKGESRAIVTR